MKRKVVYNACYGGFGLSPLAIKRYYELKYPNIELFFYKETSNYPDKNLFTKVDPDNCPAYCCKIFTKDFGDSFTADLWNANEEKTQYAIYPSLDFTEDSSRTDPFLVQVVEELGNKANGECAELHIAEIEGKFRIDEYDGAETVMTPEDYTWS